MLGLDVDVLQCPAGDAANELAVILNLAYSTLMDDNARDIYIQDVRIAEPIIESCDRFTSVFSSATTQLVSYIQFCGFHSVGPVGTLLMLQCVHAKCFA